MIDIETLTPGESYACRFRVDGPGEYEGIGLLLTRDLENRLVKLRDVNSMMELTVPFDNIWDIDYVNWIEDSQKP